MIWVERNQNKIVYYTADGMIFENMSTAVKHIKDNIDVLVLLSESFDKYMSRNKKIKKLTIKL